MVEQLHGREPPSVWVQRWSHLVCAGGTVLDVACGYGRHLRWFASLDHPVVGVDNAQEAVDALADLVHAGGAQVLLADIENAPWPLTNGAQVRQFDAVVVTNYLWRPLLPLITRSLAPGGVLLYETFAHGNATLGKPSRPDFLLMPGELLRVCSELRVVAYEDGYCDDRPRFIQRVAAVRPRTDSMARGADTEVPPRYPLAG